MKILVTGNIFTLLDVGSREEFLKDTSDKLAEEVQKEIIIDFERSVQLATLAGAAIDQEAIRAIYRSLKVKVKTYYPLELEAKFEDDYSHWYVGEELPQEMADVLQDIIDTSLKEWFNSNKPGKIIEEALVS